MLKSVRRYAELNAVYRILRVLPNFALFWYGEELVIIFGVKRSSVEVMA